MPFAAAHNALGAVPASSRLTIEVWLKPQTAAAENYATAVSTPGSPLFEHYLSPAAYTARFGATSQEASSVESWLKSAGFTGVSADSGRDYVQATAAVSTIDAAMKVQLNYYRSTASVNAGQYRLRANDRAVSLPASVAASALGVTGLDNAAPVRTYSRPAVAPPATTPGAAGKPIAFPCSQWYAQHYAHRLPKQYGTTSFPTIVCGYTADQLRAAYGYNRHNIGKGVTIALVEVGLTPDMFLTLQDYAKANRIQSPSPSRYAELSLGQGSACGDPFDVEEQLDVEASYTMAPLANQLVVGGDSCNNGFFGLQALFNADTTILNGVGGPPAGADRVELLGGQRRGAATQRAEHRARVPGAGRRRGRQHALLRRRRLRCGDSVERPVRHRGRRHHARHRQEGPAALRDRLVNRLVDRCQQQVGLPG